MPVLRRILREPLLHFLIAGGAIYLLFAWWRHGDGAPDQHRVIVDRGTLLQYMQFQAQAFEPKTFGAQFDAMAPAQRRQLIDDYVREEVLYREAKALGMERGDYVMRQRLVQKMGFLLEEQVDVQPSDGELRRYIDARSAQYQVVPSWTFAHVFIDRAQRGDSQAQREALRLLAVLNRAHAPFNDAPRYTDRFPFLQNYVERTQEYIASQFGAEFAQALRELPVGTGQWQGPLRSEQGWHLVLLTAHDAGRMPALTEIRAQVLDDWRRDRAAQLQEQSIRTLMAGYKVELRGVAPATQ